MLEQTQKKITFNILYINSVNYKGNEFVFFLYFICLFGKNAERKCLLMEKYGNSKNMEFDFIFSIYYGSKIRIRVVKKRKRCLQKKNI